MERFRNDYVVKYACCVWVLILTIPFKDSLQIHPYEINPDSCKLLDFF